MSKRFFMTTAIDYPNSRPHIGTAFEKIGADAQARFQRMLGNEVFFLMGNDENTVKVAKRAEELGQDPKAYCDTMADQFKEVWRALDLSFTDFIQTSEERHHKGCQAFIQKVKDNGHIYKGSYEGWYCNGCESFKSDRELDANQCCPTHNAKAVRRQEPCWFFALSTFREKLLDFYRENPDFIQPESRHNEVLNLVETELKDVNITRSGETWGIRVPFDPEFTIYVWFDALLNYITAIGYGFDESLFSKWWPADLHVIGKDITRFHCALWPAMCMAAGIAPPKRVFGHGFVHHKGEKMSKTIGNVVEPMDLLKEVGPDAFRYFFLRECPYPGDGDFSYRRFIEVYNADLANNLGNLYSRVVGLIGRNFGGALPPMETPTCWPGVMTRQEIVEIWTGHMDGLRYNQALQLLWAEVLVPANQHADKMAPWSLVKTDLSAAALVLRDLVEPIRVVSILLKPFLPKVAQTLYESFSFDQAWDRITPAHASQFAQSGGELRILAPTENGKVEPLFPRLQAKAEDEA